MVKKVEKVEKVQKLKVEKFMVQSGEIYIHDIRNRLITFSACSIFVSVFQ
jgi:hypothetical protein